MQSKNIVLKISFKETTKRIRELPQSYEDLLKLIGDNFPELSGKASLHIIYQDCDGDKITITNSKDLQESYLQTTATQTHIKFEIHDPSAKEKGKKKKPVKPKHLIPEENSQPPIQGIAEENQFIGSPQNPLTDSIPKEDEKILLEEGKRKSVHPNVYCDGC